MQRHDVASTLRPSLQRRCNVMTLHRRWGDHDVNITSPQRRCNVMTLHRRWGDVIFTSCACPEDWYPHNTFCYSQWKHVLWYSLEKSRRCDSDGYPQHMLSWKNEENISTFRLRKKMCFITGFFFFYQISSFLLNTNLNWPKQILSISFCDNLHIKIKKWRNIYFQKKKKNFLNVDCENSVRSSVARGKSDWWAITIDHRR